MSGTVDRFSTGKGKLGMALVLVAMAMLAACSSGGGGGGGASALQVVSFEFDGTEGLVYRDQALEFEFSAAIDTESVSAVGLRVLTNTNVIPGRIEIDGRTIRWYPVVLEGDRNDYVPDNRPPVNGVGLDANTRYTVQMTSNASTAIKSKKGRPLSTTFVSNFVTSDEFQPENPTIPPTVILEESPVFEPAPLVDGDPFSPNPADWPILDPAEVTITIQMSERIRPGSIDPFSSVTVTNVTDIPNNPPAGVGEIALMNTRLSPGADQIIIQNVVSLGDWPDSEEPFEFQVVLTEEVADFAGLGLEEPLVFHFRTIDRPREPNFVVFTELFNNQDNLDPDNTSARWGDGALEGSEVQQRFDDYIPAPQSNFNLSHPLVEPGNPQTPLGCRFQMKYDTNHIPAVPGESISGMAWSPRSNFSFNAMYRNVTIRMGSFASGDGEHLNPLFDVNYLQQPITVFRGDYEVPFSLNVMWVDWPDFTRDFDIDPDHPTIFEWDMPEGGDTFQLFKNRSSSSAMTHRSFADGGSERAVTLRENTQYNTRFYFVSKRSFGQSIPIPTELPAADFGGFLIVEDPDRSGTVFEPEWGGSFAGAPPLSFSANLDDADGFSHLTFRLSLTANPQNGAVPKIRSVSFAWEQPRVIEE